jgi:hypothetical protein
MEVPFMSEGMSSPMYANMVGATSATVPVVRVNFICRRSLPTASPRQRW